MQKILQIWWFMRVNTDFENIENTMRLRLKAVFDYVDSSAGEEIIKEKAKSEVRVQFGRANLALHLAANKNDLHKARQVCASYLDDTAFVGESAAVHHGMLIFR